MSSEQYVKYAVARQEERIAESKKYSIGSQGKMQKPETKGASYKVKSRMALLSVMPDDDEWTDEMLEETELARWSPKIRYIVMMAQRLVGQIIIYFPFIKMGVTPCARALRLLNKKVGVLTGEQSLDERDEVVRASNAGELDIVIVSKAGMIGVDFTLIEHAIAACPEWKWSDMRQFFDRIYRIGALKTMPKSRRIINRYILVGVYPAGETMISATEEKTTDEELLHKSNNARVLIEDAMSLYVEASIDCNYHKDKKNSNVNCRLCMPNNRKLYTRDFTFDSARANPCQQMQVEEVDAKEITIGDRTLMRSGTTLYEFKKNINGYLELDPSDPAYASLKLAS